MADTTCSTTVKIIVESTTKFKSLRDQVWHTAGWLDKSLKEVVGILASVSPLLTSAADACRTSVIEHRDLLGKLETLPDSMCGLLRLFTARFATTYPVCITNYTTGSYPHHTQDAASSAGAFWYAHVWLKVVQDFKGSSLVVPTTAMAETFEFGANQAQFVRIVEWLSLSRFAGSVRASVWDPLLEKCLAGVLDELRVSTLGSMEVIEMSLWQGLQSLRSNASRGV